MRGPAPPPGEFVRPRETCRADAVAVLADRVFVHARPADAGDVAALVGSGGGLVLTGARPARAARRCREEHGYTGPIIFDVAAAEHGIADGTDPFGGADDRLFEATLEQRLQGQLDAGADAALTPTRYLRAGDLGAVEAAIRGVAGLCRDDVILALPMDRGWLAPGLIDKVIDVLADVPLPKAIMLGGRSAAPRRVLGDALSVRRLVTEVPNAALFRTDLAGLDAVVHGGLAASIGTSAALRRVTAPGEVPDYGRPPEHAPLDRSPRVLVPDLMSYVHGPVLAAWFGDRPAPYCECAWCGGRSLAGFVGQADRRDARLHGVAVWSALARGIQDAGTAEERKRFWRRLCRDAIAAHARYDALIRSRKPVFVPPERLWVWAAGDCPPAT